MKKETIKIYNSQIKRKQVEESIKLKRKENKNNELSLYIK
jgi:hypothetical protein